jgi:hypothetical protein
MLVYMKKASKMPQMRFFKCFYKIIRRSCEHFRNLEWSQRRTLAGRRKLRDVGTYGARLTSAPRARFFAFFPSLRAPNSFRVASRRPSSVIRVLPALTCFLLCDLRRAAASLAARSSAISCFANTSLCDTIAAPFM